MLTGIRYQAAPSSEQAEILSQWMGCARVIWNAKCDEDRYLRTFARKYLPVGTYPPIDKAYSQYKTELTPWLSKPRKDQLPASVWIRKNASRWTVSFSHDDDHLAPDTTMKDHLAWLLAVQCRTTGARHHRHRPGRGPPGANPE